jgi:hypothetical protein
MASSSKTQKPKDKKKHFELTTAQDLNLGAKSVLGNMASSSKTQKTKDKRKNYFELTTAQDLNLGAKSVLGNMASSSGLKCSLTASPGESLKVSSLLCATLTMAISDSSSVVLGGRRCSLLQLPMWPSFGFLRESHGQYL